MLDWRELQLQRLELPEDLPEVRNGFHGPGKTALDSARESTVREERRVFALRERRVTHVESRVLDPCSMITIELHIEVPQQLSSHQTCFGKR